MTTDRYIVIRRWPVRAGRGWVIAHPGYDGVRRFTWGLHRNIYGAVLWLGPIGIGYIK